MSPGRNGEVLGVAFADLAGGDAEAADLLALAPGDDGVAGAGERREAARCGSSATSGTGAATRRPASAPSRRPGGCRPSARGRLASEGELCDERMRVDMQPERRYSIESYGKLERPKGWGSLSPDQALGSTPEGALEQAQALLVSGVEEGRSIYDVHAGYAFRAEEHLPGVWHGFPIPWSRLPIAAVRGLIAGGRMDMSTYRKAIRKNWGSDER